MTPKELKQKFSELSPIDPNPRYHTWPRHQLTIREHALNDDPLKMLNWSTIVATMFVGSDAAFTKQQLAALPKHYLAAIKEPNFGSPQLYDGWTSGNLIHQAYHLWQWERKTGRQVKYLNTILEFGAGYGAMNLICRRLGFEGEYTILDLPELALLQQFYLSNTLDTMDDIKWITDIDNKGLYVDLLIALYSLSEVSIAKRQHIGRKIQVESCLIAHQNTYGLPDGTRIDNEHWSLNLVTNAALKWHRWRHDLPGLETHWYVVGVSNG